MGKNLFNKVWDLHKIGTLPSGQDQLFIGLHLIHEVTSPQAFHMLKERGLKVLHPDRTFATVDHIVPTESQKRPFQDTLAEQMMLELEKNCRDNKIEFFNINTDYQGIVHIIGPELGLTQPGMTIACGDSHTATHGAFGAIAYGIGTSQIRDILATQTMAIDKPKVRKIHITGKLKKGVYAKDIILRIMADLGVEGGLGYAYEYCGPAIEALSMEERMTICNMSIEGGARCGYINPDQTTFDYLKGRKYSPQGKAFDKAVEFWKSIASDKDAQYDDVYELNADTIEPMITWGINPGHAIGISQKLPLIESMVKDQQETAKKAYEHMKLTPGTSLIGTPLNVVFIGSCTNGRISDFREAARILKGKKVSPSLKVLIVPGSKQVAKQMEAEGLNQIFADAGVQVRDAGCSMCLAMNPDKLKGDEISASSSNRNFIGRQGSPKGRTLLMSPAMAAACAIAGKVVDVRDYL